MALRWPLGRTKPETVAKGAYPVLLASEGRTFTADAIRQAAGLARSVGGKVRILTVARLWGSSFGLPNPGLRPSKREITEQDDNVYQAIKQLEKLGVAADGHIVVSRTPCKSILREAKRLGCVSIVMGADERRPWPISDLTWSQTPYQVLRAARKTCHLVVARTKG